MDQDNIQLTNEVIDAINGELQYQNIMAARGRAGNEDNGLPAQLLAVQEIMERARREWYGGGDVDRNSQCMHEVRKAAATLIRTLVRVGCPARYGFETGEITDADRSQFLLDGQDGPFNTISRASRLIQQCHHQERPWTL